MNKQQRVFKNALVEVSGYDVENGVSEYHVMIHATVRKLTKNSWRQYRMPIVLCWKQNCKEQLLSSSVIS